MDSADSAGDFQFFDTVMKKPFLVPAFISISSIIIILINAYGLIHGISYVLPHLFYIPIILAAYYYPHRGVLVGCILAACYCILSFVVGMPTTAEILSAIGRSLVFIIIAAVISFLSGRMHHDTRMCRRLVSVVRSSGDAIIGSTPDGIITDWNISAERLYGYTAGEMIGSSIFQLIPPGLQEEETRLLVQIHKAGTIERIETERLRKDGTRIQVSLSLSPILDSHGAVVGVSRVSHDITERQRLQQEILLEKNRWEMTFDSVPDMIAIIDSQFRVVQVNRAMADRLGVSPGEAVGLKCYEIVHHTESPVSICPHNKLLHDGVSHSTDIHEDNLHGDFFLTVTPLIDVSGAVLGSVHILRDITERKQMELALRESEENYRSIIENMQDLYYRTDLNGVITMASPEGVRLLGYSSPESLVGRNVSTFYIDTAEQTKLYEMLKTKGSVYSFPLRLRDRLNMTRYVTTSSHYFRDADGKIAGVEGIIHDITGRVRAEQALRESEERYRSILDNMQDVFFRVDGDNMIDMTSESAAVVFGYKSAGELIGKPVTNLWKNPQERALFLSTLRSHSNAVQDYEAEFVKADGTPFWVSISARLHTDPEGNYAGTEGTIRDISERKKMEAALKSALQKLNMLSSITRHDILNQITGLRTFLELSREDLQGTKFEAFIQKEDQAAEAIQRQIEFTRYYQDIGVNAPKWQGAETVIHEAVTQLSPQNITIDADIPGIEIFADPLIVKVFFNLMENSLRHGERVTRMSFSARETDAGLVVIYEDNGVGIPAEDKKKLFQRGFGKHTGLGLFLSREILAITGISIGESGEPGRGVRFELVVPGDIWRRSGSY